MTRFRDMIAKTVQKAFLYLAGHVGLHSRLVLIARHGGQGGKPFRETVVGDDLYRKTGQWNRLERNIDRESDLYEEVITDPQSGETIRKVREPLSEHRGRGSAKRKGKLAASDQLLYEE